MKVNYLKSNCIDIKEKEALRYLRYRNNNVDQETHRTLKESISELQDIGEPKYVYITFDIENKNNIISFSNKLNVKSKNLSRLYEFCDKSTVFAATIGFEVEKRIRFYNQTNLSKGIIFDACAAAYVESLCDYIEKEIEEMASKKDILPTGIALLWDLTISHQSDILSLLNAQKLIGLSALESAILVPVKSVTAFIGWKRRNV